MRDEYAETDAESLSGSDLQEHLDESRDYDEANPHENGGWYDGWNPDRMRNGDFIDPDDRDNGIDDNLDYDPDPFAGMPADADAGNDPPQDLIKLNETPLSRLVRTRYKPQPPRGVPNPPTNRPNYTGD